MFVLIEHYFPGVNVEDLDDDELVEYYAKALWLEERNAERLARAMNKGFWGE